MEISWECRSIGQLKSFQRNKLKNERKKKNEKKIEVVWRKRNRKRDKEHKMT